VGFGHEKGVEFELLSVVGVTSLMTTRMCQALGGRSGRMQDLQWRLSSA
jgi:hypothetical protein